ncbi:MAG TPA: hypothetical protein VFE62_05825 [Gemmataceae bacterium]|nr:hypothetical protein [Gemmataceae bacterium]
MKSALLDRIRVLAESEDLEDVVQFLNTLPDAALPKDFAYRLAAAATRHGDRSILQHLAKTGLDFSRASKHGHLLLATACKADQRDTAQWLHEHGVTLLDRTTEKGVAYCSALNFDANEMPLRMVQFLVEGGAPINALVELSGEWTTPLSRAHGWSRDDVIAYLRSRGGKFPVELPEFPVELRDDPSYFNAPASLAMEQRDLQALRSLLGQAPHFVSSEFAQDRVNEAAQSGWTDGLAAFAQCGFNLNAAGRLSRPIESAAQAKQWNTVRWLVENGAEIAWSVNPKSPRGWPSYCPILRNVILGKQNDLVRLLVERGAPTEAANNDGSVFSALSMALRTNNVELQDYLRGRGALEEHQVPGFVHPLVREEKEWFAAKTPDEMIGHRGITRRSYLLYTYHCLSRLEVNRRDRRSRRFLERLMDRAENRCTEKELMEAFDAARNCKEGGIPYAFNDDEFQGCGRVAEIMSGGDDKRMNEILAKMADLLREIAGSPSRLRPERINFDRAKLAQEGVRCVELDKKHRTKKVVELATSMYERDEFSDMPALADALEEAGCTSQEILRHCRAKFKHVRGCWVIDLILAKDPLPDLPEGFRISS